MPTINVCTDLLLLPSFSFLLADHRPFPLLLSGGRRRANRAFFFSPPPTRRLCVPLPYPISPPRLPFSLSSPLSVHFPASSSSYFASSFLFFLSFHGASSSFLIVLVSKETRGPAVSSYSPLPSPIRVRPIAERIRSGEQSSSFLFADVGAFLMIPLLLLSRSFSLFFLRLLFPFTLPYPSAQHILFRPQPREACCGTTQ